MSDLVKELRQGSLNNDDYRWKAAARIEQLEAEVKVWQGHARTAIWSDSEECKLLTADNERLRAAMDVVRASGLLIGSTTLHDRVRAVVHAALTQEPSNDR